MKKNKKLILGLFMILIIIGGVIYHRVSEPSTHITSVTEITHIKNEILQSKIEDYDYKELKSIENKVIDELEHSKDDITIAQCNFILGNVYMITNNPKEAIDSFNKSINYFYKIKDIPLKMKTYFELSRAYLTESKFNESEEAFNNLKNLGINKNKKEEVIKYSIKRAYDIFNYPGGKSKSIEILEDALKISKDIDYYEIEDVYFQLGRAYWYEDRLVESINSKLKALNIARGKNSKDKIINISIDIGLDYLKSRNYDEALTYLSRVIYYKMKDENNSPIIKSYAFLNLTECYVRLEKYDDAEESIKSLDENIKKIKNVKEKEDLMIMSYINKADLQTEKENPLEAIKLLNIARDRQQKSVNFKYNNFDIKLFEEYGDAYYKLNDFKKALKYHKESEKLALNRDLVYLQEIYNEKIYLDYKSMGDDENTILYLEKNMELKTKLSQDKNKQYSQYLIKEFENEENLEKISLLEKSKDKMSFIFLVLFIAIIVISIFLYFIYKKNKEINRLNKLFKNLSEIDALTNVYNRRALGEFLADNWDLYKETKMPISFMMIDLDYFKLYNDNYGHLKGDEVLEKVALEIKKSCRDTDFVARYGGEEFIVIMLNTDKDYAINLAQNIRQNIYNININHKYSKVSDRITLSIGITTAYMGTNKNYDEYIQKADKALYDAKSRGKDTYVFLY